MSRTVKNYFPEFNLSDYTSFISSVHLQSYLNESIPAELSEEKKMLFLRSIKYYIIEKLFSHNREKKQSTYNLAEKFIVCSRQVQELKKMVKRRKKGRSIPLLSKKDKEILSQTLELPSEEKLSDEYAKYMKKVEKEKKKWKKNPTFERKYAPISYEQWKDEMSKEFERKVEERRKVKNRCEHLFEEQPSVDEVKKRVKEYKKRLERLDEEIQNYVLFCN